MTPAAPARAFDASPSLWRDMFQGLDHGVCVVHILCDDDGKPRDYRIVDSNPAFEDHTGLRDAIGRTVLDMVPAIEPFWIETYGSVGLTGEPVRFEHRAEGLDGGWFEVYAWRIGEPHERLVAISFRNVKERKLADDEREMLLRDAQAERQRLADVFDMSPSFMAVLGGADHRILRCNAQYRTLLNGRDVEGLTIAQAVPEAIDQGFVALLDGVYRTGQPFVAQNMRFARRRTGGEPGVDDRYLDFVFQALRDPQGAITGVFVQGIDVTERSLAEEALRDADRRKDEFLATLAHELRNPLAPVMNSLAVLDKAAARLPPGAELPAAAAARATMWRQMRQLVRLVDDLLDVSRISRGLIELRRERVALRAVVEQAVESVRPLFDAAGQQLATALPPEPLWLQADPARLVQVIGNLLSNASRYSPQGASARVAAERCGAEIAISVEDTGIGIPAADLDSIFGLFTQLDHSTARSSSGLGIGLYLVRRLAELHGGRVTATSGGPGQGSRFVLVLPADASADAAAPADAAAGAADAGRCHRVLIADDNIDAAESMAALLQLDGHVTQIAADGLQAVQDAARFRPDVVVLDIGMPGIDGYEACRRIRRLPGGDRIKIVALTGWGREDDKRKSSDAGFDGHLVKPAGPESLHALFDALGGFPELPAHGTATRRDGDKRNA